MAKSRYKWKCIFIFYIILQNVFTKSLPVNEKSLPVLTTTDTEFKKLEIPLVTETLEELSTIPREKIVEVDSETDVKAVENVTRSLIRNTADVRPGQTVNRYTIEITDEGDSFRGRAILELTLSPDTREDAIVLHADGLNIEVVRANYFSETGAQEVDFGTDGPILEIFPNFISQSYVVIIEYTGQYSFNGLGLHKGEYDEYTSSYLAMNLHPTYARRVFPCLDEPTQASIISFTYNDIPHNTLLSNSMLEDGTSNQFRALQGPPHLWGMVAHSFSTLNLPTPNVVLYGRSEANNQINQASVTINSYFHNLIDWTNRDYFDIILNQDGRMNIVGLPDISTDFHSLSTIGLWEPYVFMQNIHSVKQRKIALYEIAKAMATQWFGYVIYPENWRYEWVISGLATYAGYEVMKMFQENPIGEDVTLLDVNTLFVTEIIQESLLRDAHEGSPPIEPGDDLFEEPDIRDHVNGLLRYKAPALLRMMRIVLGDPEDDFIQSAARALVTGRSDDLRGLQPVSSLHLVDAINSDWLANGNEAVGDIGEYLEQWIYNSGYPVLHVGLRQGGVLITQERFSFGNLPHAAFLIPITYTTSINPDFSSYQPVMVTDATTTLNFVLDEEDWVLFNIQGQGYYRVNYDENLWERIIEALEDPDRREEIHPLNRATLVDDALNLARANQLSYDIAFRVVLSMEHETEYAVWRAFIRNMEFLRRRLVAYVADEDDDRDPDIYLRMVRRTVGAVEDALGFDIEEIPASEPAMDTLTRGMVMEHACKANYIPCIAAAIDLFWHDNGEEVNPNIPFDMRPAVYCTMVREGDDDVVSALYARLEVEPTIYERVVILEALACSQDDNFIRMYLEETLANNSPYSVEERNRIFIAITESSTSNANIAMNFMSRRAGDIINMYGGLHKLEKLIYVLAENMADEDLSGDFRIWVNSQQNNLDDASEAAVERALMLVEQNLRWDQTHMEDVYEWIDENHASTMMLSLIALCISLIVGLLNH